jgi:hypothetical protein
MPKPENHLFGREASWQGEGAVKSRFIGGWKGIRVGKLSGRAEIGPHRLPAFQIRRRLDHMGFPRPARQRELEMAAL